MTVTSPAQGAIVAGTVVLDGQRSTTAERSGRAGSKRVEYSVDGNARRVTQGPPGRRRGTPRVSNGDHSIVATAWDADGNTASSSVASGRAQHGRGCDAAERDGERARGGRDRPGDDDALGARLRCGRGDAMKWHVDGAEVAWDGRFLVDEAGTRTVRDGSHQLAMLPSGRELGPWWGHFTVQNGSAEASAASKLRLRCRHAAPRAVGDALTLVCKRRTVRTEQGLPAALLARLRVRRVHRRSRRSRSQSRASERPPHTSTARLASSTP